MIAIFYQNFLFSNIILKKRNSCIHLSEVFLLLLYSLLQLFSIWTRRKQFQSKHKINRNRNCNRKMIVWAVGRPLWKELEGNGKVSKKQSKEKVTGKAVQARRRCGVWHVNTMFTLSFAIGKLSFSIYIFLPSPR